MRGVVADHARELRALVGGERRRHRLVEAHHAGRAPRGHVGVRPVRGRERLRVELVRRERRAERPHVRVGLRRVELGLDRRHLRREAALDLLDLIAKFRNIATGSW